ncbi:MAG: cereblon family protein [bacterium]
MFQFPFQVFDRGVRREPTGALVPIREREHAPAHPAALVCVACGHAITTAAARTERFGSHAHVFANPEGIRFEIGCFAAAPGVVLLGEETSAYTWFRSFAWTVASCARCGVQLGWRYRSSAGSVFYGLILERLRETGDAPSP